jgi:thiamine transporter ThiT
MSIECIIAKMTNFGTELLFIPRKATNCGFSLAMNTNSCVAQACLRALLLMLIAHRKKRNLQPSEV